MKVERNLQTKMSLVLFCISLAFGVAATVDASIGVETQTSERVATARDAPEIHALLILRDDDVKIFNSVEINERYMKNMLRQLNVKADAMKVLAGERNYYTADVINWIENRNVQPNDTIFIYFNGHGHIDGNEHFLKINDSRPTLRRNLTRALSEKNCRLKMLITDTCSSDLILKGLPEGYSTQIEAQPQPQHYLEDLFYKHEGMLDITAAASGQDAWSNNAIGGYFTNALSASITSEVDKDRDRFVSWQEVFELAQFKTNEHFSQSDFTGKTTRDGEPITQTRQTPFQYSLPTPIRAKNNPSDTVADAVEPEPRKSVAFLNVTSTPSGASVFIDNILIGTTPLRGYKVDIGEAKSKDVAISLSLEGYKSDTLHLKTLEPGKTKSVNGQLRRIELPIPAGPSEVHALLIINYGIDLYESAKMNVKRIKHFLSPIGVKPDVWYTETDAKTYTGEDILNWIKNRNVKSGDTILVYYAGHGYMDLNNKQYLTISGGNLSGLPRSALIEVLSKKNCRLKMLITESSSSGGQKLRSSNSPQFRQGRIEPQKANTNDEEKKSYLEDLFYKHKGLLDIAAASPGQDAWANRVFGAFFTYALTSSINYQVDRNGDKFHSWKEVFDFAQSETEKVFMQSLPEISRIYRTGISQETQTPFQYSLPTPTFRVTPTFPEAY